MDLAKQIYTARFPNVQLEWKQFDSMEDFTFILTAELAAGKGPDLIAYHRETFPDIYKLAETGVFMNLDIFLNEDPTFDKSAYIGAVFDGGYIRSERVFIPIVFDQAYVIADQATLHKAHITLSDTPTFSEWSDQIKAFLKSDDCAGAIRLFDDIYPNFALFFTQSGVQILDYETKELYIDREEFHQFIDFYQEIYPFGNQKEYPDTRMGPFPDIMDALVHGELLFDIASEEYTVFEIVEDMEAKEYPDIIFPFPRFGGSKSICTGYEFLSINHAGRNKRNAYEFMKIMLSEPVQSWYFSGAVHKKALALRTSEEYVAALDGQGNSLHEFTQGAEYYNFYSKQLIHIVYDTFLPYFKKQAPYDHCIEILRDKLMIYINE